MTNFEVHAVWNVENGLGSDYSLGIRYQEIVSFPISNQEMNDTLSQEGEGRPNMVYTDQTLFARQLPSSASSYVETDK